MRFARVSILVSLALLLAGCFDVDQTLRVFNEHEAVFEVRASVPASTIAAAQRIPAIAGRPFCADKTAAERLGLSVSVETLTDGENQICAMRARGSLQTIARVAADRSYLPKDAPPQADALTYLLEPEGPGLWRLTVTLVTPAELKMVAGSDDITRTAQAMIFGSVDGRGISWALEAAEIVDSTGTISADRRRAEFKIPLAELLSSPQPEYSFVATFRP